MKVNKSLKKLYADAEMSINKLKNLHKKIWGRIVYFSFLNYFLKTKYSLKDLRDVVDLGIKLGIE